MSLFIRRISLNNEKPYYFVSSYLAAILNPAALNSWFHMVLAILETALFVIGGISAWYILNKRHPAFFSKSFKIAIALAILVTPLQIIAGHFSGEQVYHNQPTKLAAIEALWETVPAGKSAPWNVLVAPNVEEGKNNWTLSIPDGLGMVLAMKPQLSEPVLGLMEPLNTTLPLLWFGLVALFLTIYLITDGFDLGVGILTLYHCQI